jgi:hypothetical protein
MTWQIGPLLTPLVRLLNVTLMGGSGNHCHPSVRLRTVAFSWLKVKGKKFLSNFKPRVAEISGQNISSNYRAHLSVGKS